MQQSSVIFFTIFFAFVIFITQKGELPVYLGLLLLSPAGGSSAPTPASSSSGSSVSDVVGTASKVADLAAMFA